MANFDAKVVLNTVVNQASLNKAAASIQKVTQAAKQIKPINLFAPGSGAGADKIKTSLTEINKVVKNINAGNKGPGKLSTTFAGASQQASVLLDVLSNVNLNTRAAQTQIEDYAQGFVVANQQAKKQEKILNDIIRKAQGLQPQGVRDAEVARRKRLLQDRELERKAQQKTLAIEKQRAREQAKIARDAERAAKAAERDAAAKKKARNQRLNDVALGVGFPLLFGGNLGSVAGGGLGALLGGGLGGQIIGSALGQVLNDAATAAGEFAKQATKASTSLDQLATALGTVGTASASRSRFADSLGIGGAARAAQTGALESIVGQGGVNNLEQLARSAEDAGNALNRFGAATSSFFAPLLTTINDAISTLFGGISKAEQAQRLRDQPPNRSAGTGPGSAARAEFNRAAAARDTALQNDPEVKAQLKLEEQINKVLTDRIQLAKDQTALEESRLTSRRDTFASDQASLRISAEQNKLTVLKIQLQGELEASKRRELELERDLTKEALAQAEAAKKNAIIEAERAIFRDQQQALAAGATAAIQAYKLEQQRLDIQRSTVDTIASRLSVVEQEYGVNARNLEIQRQLALLGKTEIEVIKAINFEYDAKLLKLNQELELKRELARQEQLAYEASRRNFEQQLMMQQLQGSQQADAAIRANDPSYAAQFSGAGLGFFGDSAKVGADLLADYAAQLEVFNEKIAFQQSELQTALESGAAEKTVELIRDRIRALENERDVYTKNQPAINAAILAQARYRDALAFTTPAATALVGALKSVVAGTATAQEALAGFAQAIGDIFLNKAAELIAESLATVIAESLGKAAVDAAGDAAQAAAIAAAVGTSVTAANAPLIAVNTALAALVAPLTAAAAANTAAVAANTAALIATAGFAEGGYVTKPTTALIGEGGENEYVIPESKMAGAMARYGAGERGESLLEPAPTNYESGGETEVTDATPTAINILGGVTVMNNEEYIRKDEIPSIVAQASKAGEARTMRKLQMNPGARRKIGMRG